MHGVVQLMHTWRFGGAIDALARAIRAADADTAVAVLRSGAGDVQFSEIDLESAATEASARVLRVWQNKFARQVPRCSKQRGPATWRRR